MRSWKTTLALAIASALFTTTAQAATISATYLADPTLTSLGSYAPLYSGYTYECINSATCTFTTPDVSADHRSPFRDGAGQPTGDQYFAARTQGRDVKLNFNGTQDSLALLWGSVDQNEAVGPYNKLTFYLGDTAVLTLTGSDIIGLLGSPVGFVEGVSNALVLISDIQFDSIVAQDLTSMNAFEFQPLQQVPEPVTMTLLGLGLLGLAASRRRN